MTKPWLGKVGALFIQKEDAPFRHTLSFFQRRNPDRDNCGEDNVLKKNVSLHVADLRSNKPDVPHVYIPEMEDTIKIELLTPLTGTFLPNEMEQDWEEEDYNDFEEEQVFFEGDDLTEYASVIQEKIAEYNRVGHDDDRTDNLMDYFDGSAAIKEKVVSAVPSVKESDGVLYGCTTLELKEYLEAEELSELCEYLTRQYSDGWGEGFEQQEIPVEGGELCIHFWRPIDFEFQQAKSEVSKEKSEKQENPVNVPKRLKMQLLGMDGNVFAVMARASKLLQENGQGQEAKEMIARVQKSENYYQALHIISEYVETELSASSQNDTKPPKKRGKEECR